MFAAAYPSAARRLFASQSWTTSTENDEKVVKAPQTPVPTSRSSSDPTERNVTLGALHFEEAEDDDHALAKGYKRHPDLGDHVVVGTGSNVLGPIEIGDHVSVGANAWVTDDVSDHTSVFVSEHPEQARKPTD